MDATYIEKQVEQLKRDIFRFLQHKTLLKYTGEPEVNEHQLFYMLLPFFNGDAWDDGAYKGAIAIGIIEASLAKHSLIGEHDEMTKKQQLLVLSGDYYSGRYYEILANSGNISLIYLLSESVVLRAEHEIRVYETNLYTTDDWLESFEIIESDFIHKFYQFYNYEQYANIMKTNLLILRLQNELLNYRKGNSSLFLQKMKEAYAPVGQLSFEQFLMQTVDGLMHQLKELLRTSSMKTELKQYIAERLIREC